MNHRLRHKLPTVLAGVVLCALATPASATLQAGQAALESFDYEGALREFGEAARGGSADAQYEMGLLYALGRGGIQQDYREAAAWFGRAADQGHAKAQVRLADLMAQGLGVPQDYDKARVLLRAAVPRLQGPEKRYADSYAVSIDALIEARAMQASAPAGPARPVPPSAGQPAGGQQAGGRKR